MPDADRLDWLEPQLVEELQVVRRTGLGGGIRQADLTLIPTIARELYGSADPEAIVSLLVASAQSVMGGSDLRATESLFGLTKGMRLSSDSRRRKAAAEHLGIMPETFRKKPQERLLAEIARGIRLAVENLDPPIQFDSAGNTERNGLREALDGENRLRHHVATVIDPTDESSGVEGVSPRYWYQRHPWASALAVMGIIGFIFTVLSAAGTFAPYFGRGPGQSSISASVTSSPVSFSSQPVPAALPITPDHLCWPVDRSQFKPEEAEICVTAWCQGTVYRLDGLEAADQATIKLRPRVINGSGGPIDLSIGRFSALRLLVSAPTLPGAWQPPPNTAAAEDHPIEVSWEGQTYWAIPPDLPEHPPIVQTSMGSQYTRFVTIWDGAILESGQAYYKPIRHEGNDPNRPVVQEGDLVFSVPMNNDGSVKLFGLALVKRENDSTRVVTVSRRSSDWPASQTPSSF